jgi:hypothetical protein
VGDGVAVGEAGGGVALEVTVGVRETLVAVGEGVSVVSTAASGACVTLTVWVGLGVFIACWLPPQVETSKAMTNRVNRRVLTCSSSLP